MEESIYVTFEENRKCIENMLDSEEEEFRFQSSIQDELCPSIVENEDDDDRPVPSSGILPINFFEAHDQVNNEDDDVQEDLAPLDEPTEKLYGDVQQPSQFKYRSFHPSELLLFDP